MMDEQSTVGRAVVSEGNADPKIRVRDVSKTFSVRGIDTLALQSTSLDVAQGEFVSLVGPSGCGKSTILNMIAGLLSPTSGEVFYGGAPVRALNGRAGYMTQKDTLLPWRTAEANIRLPLELACRDVSQSQIRDRVADIMQLVGLTGFEKHYPAELSGGMRKRVSLARILIYEPETLLMDEPFGALDAQLKLLMHDLLQRLAQQRKMTVLFVTHDLAEAIALSDRVFVMSARPGRIRVAREIPLGRPRDVFTVRFVDTFSHLHEELWHELKDEVQKGTDV